MSKRITKSTVLKLGCLMILALGASTLAADPGLGWADWTTYMMGVDADNLDAVKTALQGGREGRLRQFARWFSSELQT